MSQFWSYRWNLALMAANGYVVIAPNRRGLPGFGTEWNEQISKDYPGQNMRDYLSAVDNLKTEPWIDAKRIGATGASYGGFSIYFLAGHHEGRFAAFLAHAGIFNMEQQYLETEEMWFANWDMGGAYWEKDNAVAQRTFANSPHRFVDRWDTPIMVSHGEYDYRILASQGMAAFNAAKLRGIPAEMVIYPDENHWILKPQNAVLWQRLSSAGSTNGLNKNPHTPFASPTGEWGNLLFYQMSKAALKKELKSFTPEQLTEVILNVYDSSKEAKAYLEFFLNPDPDAFLKEKFEAILKELKRTKRGGVSKGRISVIRQMIKQGMAYGLTPDYIDKLMMGAISLLVSAERYIYYPASLFNGTYRLVSDYIVWANKAGMLAAALDQLSALIGDTEIGTEIFRRNISQTVAETVGNIKKSGL